MPESQIQLNEINKVYIPCRTVIEMEILTSLFFENKNYNDIKELAKAQPSTQKLIQIYQVKGIDALERIIKHFTEVILNKLKPIVMYQRDFHDRMRMGNIVSNSKSRICLFLILHRLKLKFLIIHNFLENLKEHNFDFGLFDDVNNFIKRFYQYFYDKNIMNLKYILKTKRISERVSSLIDLKDIIIYDDLLAAISFKEYLNDRERIKFIMREIKAPLFISKLMFGKIDVFEPFIKGKDVEVDPEQFMVSQDFLPSLIPAISQCVKEKNKNKLNEYVDIFYFMLENILEGIDYAIDIASGGQIEISRYEPIFSSGNMFEV